jgi:hypothetical protein
MTAPAATKATESQEGLAARGSLTEYCNTHYVHIRPFAGLFMAPRR